MLPRNLSLCYYGSIVFLQHHKLSSSVGKVLWYTLRSHLFQHSQCRENTYFAIKQEQQRGESVEMHSV